MIRIGIIGTENSHAMAFAKYYNLPDPITGKMHYDDIRLTAILGDKQSTDAIIAAVGEVYVADCAEDLLDKVDAVMITSRKGSVHYRYAMPFVERGIPLFVDKPFTSNLEEAQLLAGKIEARGVRVMGGSGCKYAPVITAIRDKTISLRESGEFGSAAMSFRVMLDSPYDGIHFYAPHLVEMCLQAFGADIRAVQAVRTGDSLIAVMQYEHDAVSLHFNGKSISYGCTIFGNKENYHFSIDISSIYEQEARGFADLLLGKAESLAAEQLWKPVQIVDAIQRAMETGTKIVL